MLINNKIKKKNKNVTRINKRQIIIHKNIKYIYRGCLMSCAKKKNIRKEKKEKIATAEIEIQIKKFCIIKYLQIINYIVKV